MSTSPDKRARVRAMVVVIVVPLILAVACGTIFWTKAVHTVAQTDSPDGAWTATIRVIRPGLSAGYSTHVIVAGSDAWWPVRKNKVFVADDADGAVPLGDTRELPLRVHWEDKRHLVISYPAKARIYRQEKNMGPVTITYNIR